VLAAALGDGAAPLKVIFETDVSRCHRVTHHGGAHIELALDVGIVRAGADELALHEIEFELVDGPVAGLLDLARCWVERHGLWLDVRSKAERGYLLAHGMTVTSATKAKVRPVSDDMATERALRQLVEGCLDHILPNAAALAAGLADDDHLEQAKLGLRKLHDALTPQIDSVPAGVDERWHQLLAELCTQLDEPTPPTPGIAGLSPALQIDAAGVAGGADPTDRANAQLAGRKDSAGAALRSPSSGALWLDLLAFAHPEQAS
jgi:inorganic triphosphatase YgiF